MIADAARADAALLVAVEGSHIALRETRDAPAIIRILFAAAASSLERDARALDVISLFQPLNAAGPQLLPAFWSLPYEERLAACLLVVEELEPDAASAAVHIPAQILEARADRAVARLSGFLPRCRRKTSW